MKSHNARLLFAVALALSGSSCETVNPKMVPSWSDVPLEGMHWRLISPKRETESVDLHFARGGILSVSSCYQGACTSPATVWKIEGNRLKSGFVPSEGDILVRYTAGEIVVRLASGKELTYEIVSSP